MILPRQDSVFGSDIGCWTPFGRRFLRGMGLRDGTLYIKRKVDGTFQRRVEPLQVAPPEEGLLPLFSPDHIATSMDATNRFGGNLLDGKPMKINMKEFNDHLAGLAHGDPAVRRKAISELAKYSGLLGRATRMPSAPPSRPL